MRTTHSLRFQLLAIIVAALIVALLTVAIVARWATAREFERYVARQWQQLQTVAERIAVTTGDRLVIANPDGRSVNLSLAAAVAVGGTVAALLAWAFSRQVLRPIEALTVAARRMEMGELGQRVPVRTGDEVGQLARAFNSMAEGLARTERLRRSMTTEVAHELRTPLTNLRGYLEALQDGVSSPTPAVLASLHDEAVLLSRLVDDLQDLSLADAGQLKPQTRRVSVPGLLEAAAQVMLPQAKAKGIALRVAPPFEALPEVELDPERIGQVVRNLLSNALIHTPPGGAIMLSAEESAAGSEVLVRVRDTGEGIPREHLPFVFERFYRVDPSRARATGGAGIGLAVVKQLVQAHGGRVSVDSTPCTVTTFTFTLPITRAH